MGFVGRRLATVSEQPDRMSLVRLWRNCFKKTMITKDIFFRQSSFARLAPLRKSLGLVDYFVFRVLLGKLAFALHRDHNERPQPPQKNPVLALRITTLLILYRLWSRRQYIG
mmetsp:Transcript_19043/g.44366  ORF Transcript_19043/g.44366 Transcript_19043/m.44366 type:complete len:112 (+) Transcript_19043:2002-2337(+)